MKCKLAAAAVALSMLTACVSNPEISPLEEILYNHIADSYQGEIISSRYCDFDGDGSIELFAVYGSKGSGRLYYVNDSGAFMLGGEDIWSVPEVVCVEKVSLAYIEQGEKGNSVSYYYQIRNGKPYRIDTYGLMELKQAENGDFTAFHTTYDIGELKPYHFEALNIEGEIHFREYHGFGHIGEEISDYLTYLRENEGCDLQPYIDSINGEVTEIIERLDLDIFEINYVENGKKLYRRIAVKDGIITDITPESNRGHYIPNITAKYTLDFVIF